MRHARVMIGRLAILGLLAALLLVAGCESPRPLLTVLPEATAGPSPTPLPTLCAHARVSGRVCTPGATVYLRSCCPEWVGMMNADERGAFAFESISAGTYTVTSGLRSQRLVLPQCDSQASVDLCSGPQP
jgi:hypothetical protein